jgi:anti-anti-sigma factor
MVALGITHTTPSSDSIRIEAEPGRTVLHLGGAIGVAQARALHACARELASASGDVAVSAARLAHLDAAAMQVLLALATSVKSQGRAFAIQDVPAAVLQTLQLAGLDTAL